MLGPSGKPSTLTCRTTVAEPWRIRTRPERAVTPSHHEYRKPLGDRRAHAIRDAVSMAAGARKTKN